MLSGYKTYLVALAAALYAGASVWAGTMDFNDAVALVTLSLGLGSLRSAVAKI